MKKLIILFSFFIVRPFLSQYTAYPATTKTNPPPHLITQASRPSPPVSSHAIELRPAEMHTLINLNVATLTELQTLPTIGPKRAQAIIQYRDSLPNQRFTSIEQMQKVPGLSPQSFKRLHAYIIID